MKWNKTTPPKNRPIIVDSGLPWSTIAIWDAFEKDFVTVQLQVNMIGGAWNDPSFENEHESAGNIKAWMHLPDCEEAQEITND